MWIGSKQQQHGANDFSYEKSSYITVEEWVYCFKDSKSSTGREPNCQQEITLLLIRKYSQTGSVADY